MTNFYDKFDVKGKREIDLFTDIQMLFEKEAPDEVERFQLYCTFIAGVVGQMAKPGTIDQLADVVANHVKRVAPFYTEAGLEATREKHKINIDKGRKKS